MVTNILDYIWTIKKIYRPIIILGIVVFNLATVSMLTPVRTELEFFALGLILYI